MILQMKKIETRGRKPIGANAMTSTERMQRHRSAEKRKLEERVIRCKEILNEQGGTQVQITIPKFVAEIIERFQITAPLSVEQIIIGALVTWAVEESDNLPPIGWNGASR